MDKKELIEALEKAIQEHKVSSHYIEQMRGKAYSEKQDRWINVYYVTELLEWAKKS